VNVYACCDYSHNRQNASCKRNSSILYPSPFQALLSSALAGHPCAACSADTCQKAYQAAEAAPRFGAARCLLAALHHWPGWLHCCLLWHQLHKHPAVGQLPPPCNLEVHRIIAGAQIDACCGRSAGVARQGGGSSKCTVSKRRMLCARLHCPAQLLQVLPFAAVCEQKAITRDLGTESGKHNLPRFSVRQTPEQAYSCSCIAFTREYTALSFCAHHSFYLLLCKLQSCASCVVVCL
jgi:hypothetical protein